MMVKMGRKGIKRGGLWGSWGVVAVLIGNGLLLPLAFGLTGNLDLSTPAQYRRSIVLGHPVMVNLHLMAFLPLTVPSQCAQCKASGPVSVR